MPGGSNLGLLPNLLGAGDGDAEEIEIVDQGEECRGGEPGGEDGLVEEAEVRGLEPELEDAGELLVGMALVMSDEAATRYLLEGCAVG